MQGFETDCVIEEHKMDDYQLSLIVFKYFGDSAYQVDQLERSAKVTWQLCNVSWSLSDIYSFESNGVSSYPDTRLCEK